MVSCSVRALVIARTDLTVMSQASVSFLDREFFFAHHQEEDAVTCFLASCNSEVLQPELQSTKSLCWDTDSHE